MEVLNAFVFTALDWLDDALSLVFRLLDSLLDIPSSSSSSSYCKGYTTSTIGQCCCCSSSPILLERGKLACGRDSNEDELQMRQQGCNGLVVEASRRFQLGSMEGSRRLPCGYEEASRRFDSVCVKGSGRFHCEVEEVSRWSDCACSICTSWRHSRDRKLYTVLSQGSGYDNTTDCADNNVIFLHGFLSSSSFWVESILPNFSEVTKMSHRLFFVDLLGFGRSPKPRSCSYTIMDQLLEIKDSVIEPYGIKSFHLVAHSMGCIVALALASLYSSAVKSLTLVSMPYYPIPQQMQPESYVLQKVAPRKIWPPMVFGTSVMSWYEHVGRLVCLVVCKNHCFWESVTKLVLGNRVPAFLIHDLMQHTHHSAWHIFHNVICGVSSKFESYLEILESAKCSILLVHGNKDSICPLQCSLDFKKRLPQARLNIVDGADHTSVVLQGGQSLAHTLEETWSKGK